MTFFRTTLTGLLVSGLFVAACAAKDDDKPGGTGGTAAGGEAGGPTVPEDGGTGGTASDPAGGEAGGGTAPQDGGSGGTGGSSDVLAGAPNGGAIADAGENAGGTGTAGTGGEPTGGVGGSEDVGDVEYVLDDTLGDPAVVVWKQDFEGDAADWSVTGGVWGVGPVTNVNGPMAFAGSGVAGTGLSVDYGVSNDAWIVSPAIDVPDALDEPRFRVHYWYDFAAGDTGFIYIRVVGGTWQELSRVNESGDGSWRQLVVNLGAYADQQVQIGFRITTNAAAFAPGFFIDDASFETGPQPFDKSEGFEADWGYWSTYDGVWALGTPTAADGPTAFEGSKVAGTILSGDYGISDDAWLVSPRIEVPSASEEPRFTFKYWYDFASGDTGYMYVRADGGTWQEFARMNESGDGSWRSITYPLGAFADRTVELGFRITTNAVTFAPGFYIDDARYQTGPVRLVKEQGFENGFQGWSAYDGVWAVGEPTAADGPAPHTGAAVAGTILSGDYGSSDDAWLISPRIFVPPTSDSPSFSYWYWYELAAGDTAYAYLRINGGTWQQVSTVNQSGGGLWRKQVIDLTAHKDKTVEVGFRITTNAVAFAPGFYVDDVSIKL